MTLLCRYLCGVGGLKCRNWMSVSGTDEVRDVQNETWREIRKFDGKEVEIKLSIEMSLV